jgi:hypothetical protein
MVGEYDVDQSFIIFMIKTIHSLFLWRRPCIHYFYDEHHSFPFLSTSILRSDSLSDSSLSSLLRRDAQHLRGRARWPLNRLLGCPRLQVGQRRRPSPRCRLYACAHRRRECWLGFLLELRRGGRISRELLPILRPGEAFGHQGLKRRGEPRLPGVKPPWR